MSLDLACSPIGRLTLMILLVSQKGCTARWIHKAEWQAIILLVLKVSSFSLFYTLDLARVEWHECCWNLVYMYTDTCGQAIRVRSARRRQLRRIASWTMKFLDPVSYSALIFELVSFVYLAHCHKVYDP